MNRAENLIDGHRVLPRLMADLRAARSTIHFTTFLFFNDPIGREIEEILAERARAGVRVRVIVNIEKTRIGDPFSTGEEEMMEEDPNFDGDAMDFDALAKRLRKAGVEVHDSNLDFDMKPPTDDPALLRQHDLIMKTSRMDAMHIDHRKVITIDGWVGYCGSANIGAQYLHHQPFDPGEEAHQEAKREKDAGGSEPWWKWHDGLVRFEGPIVEELDRCFRERWVLDGGDDYGRVEVIHSDRPPRGIEVDDVRLFRNQPDSTPNAIRGLFLEEILRARKSIFIESPYTYHPAIIAALTVATRTHKLDVDLIVPAMKWNDSEFSEDAMQANYERLLRAGVRVHEYQNHFTHLKIATFDERVSIVGSANLNFRSLENDNDFELVARVVSETFAKEINAEVRDRDLRYCRRLSLENLTFSERHRDPRTRLLLWRRVL